MKVIGVPNETDRSLQKQMTVSCSCSIHIVNLQIYKMENAGDALKSSKMSSFCVNPRRRREKLGYILDQLLRIPPLVNRRVENKGGILNTNATDATWISNGICRCRILCIVT